MGAASYELKKASDGQLTFCLKAVNNEVILTSERYTTKAAALKGIESVKANSGNEARFEKKTSKKNEPYFVLKGANHEVIGTSEMYSSVAARDKGIESVKMCGSIAAVNDKA